MNPVLRGARPDVGLVAGLSRQDVGDIYAKLSEGVGSSRCLIEGHHWDFLRLPQTRRAGKQTVVTGSFIHNRRFDYNDIITFELIFENAHLKSSEVKVKYCSKVGYPMTTKPLASLACVKGGWVDVAGKLVRALGEQAIREPQLSGSCGSLEELWVDHSENLARELLFNKRSQLHRGGKLWGVELGSLLKDKRGMYLSLIVKQGKKQFNFKAQTPDGHQWSESLQFIKMLAPGGPARSTATAMVIRLTQPVADEAALSLSRELAAALFKYAVVQSPRSAVRV